MIDSHCHLYYDAYLQDLDQVLERARAAGVRRFVNVGTDPVSNEQARIMSQGRPDMSFSVGLHPHHAHELSDSDVEAVESFAKKHQPIAIGEIGLDNFKSQSDAATQEKRYCQMLALAVELSLPVIVHSRDAFERTYELTRDFVGDRTRVVMHCFSYSYEQMRLWTDLGYYVSFTGNITFKSATALLDVAAKAPENLIMIETDAPYLAPQAMRGKRNEPAYLLSTAEALSTARGIALEKLSQITDNNAGRFFGTRLGI